MCSTRNLWLYHKNAIVVPMRTLKFGSFTDIKSVVLFSKKTNLNSCLNAVYYVKPVNKTQRRKTYICAPEDVLLLIINNIHNLSFLFSGLIMCLSKINVVILLHSVELLILFHHTSF